MSNFPIVQHKIRSNFFRVVGKEERSYKLAGLTPDTEYTISITALLDQEKYPPTPPIPVTTSVRTLPAGENTETDDVNEDGGSESMTSENENGDVEEIPGITKCKTIYLCVLF